jgi:hypothetical protein
MMDDDLTFLSGTELAAATLPAETPILAPILSTKSLALLYGPRGLGKTFLALGIARAAAAGESFLGWRAARPHRVLYIDGEMAAVQMQQRLMRFGPVPETLRFLLADLNRGPVLDLAHGDSQYRLTARWGDPELVVLDNLASLAGLRRGNPDRWHELHRFLMVQRQWGRGVLMIHHANKRGLQRGTGRREDILDLVMAIRRPDGWQPGDGTRFEIHFEKARTLHGAAIQPLRVGLEDGPDGFVWRHQPIDETLFEQAIELLNRGRNAAYVAGALNMSRSAAYRLRDRAIALDRLRDGTAPDESRQAETRP